VSAVRSFFFDRSRDSQHLQPLSASSSTWPSTAAQLSSSIQKSAAPVGMPKYSRLTDEAVEIRVRAVCTCSRMLADREGDAERRQRLGPAGLVLEHRLAVGLVDARDEGERESSFTSPRAIACAVSE
jgi:hypothetical protein